MTHVMNEWHFYIDKLYHSRNAVHSVNYILTLQESAGHDIAQN